LASFPVEKNDKEENHLGESEQALPRLRAKAAVANTRVHEAMQSG
jgi:hypothetical protein